MHNAAALDQPRLIANRAQRSHQPTVPVPALPDIICRRAVDVELGVVEDVHHPLDSLGPKRIVAAPICRRGIVPIGLVQQVHDRGGSRRVGRVPVLEGRLPAVVVEALVILDVVERVETVPPVELEVDLQVEMRVTVLLVDAPALLDYLGDLVPALRCRLLVGLLGGLRRPKGFR